MRRLTPPSSKLDANSAWAEANPSMSAIDRVATLPGVFREAFLFVAVTLVLLFRPQGLIPAPGLKERI